MLVFSCDYTGTIGGGESDTATIVFEPTVSGSITGNASFQC
jgi:hypothetical protein